MTEGPHESEPWPNLATHIRNLTCNVLAESHSLITQVISVGETCAVTATLYDLRLQAAEWAATRKTRCNAGSIVALLERVADGLSAHLAPPLTINSDSTETATGSATVVEPERFLLAAQVVPSSARILFDGRETELGMLNRKIEAGTTHQLAVEKPGDRPQAMTIPADRERRIRVELDMEPEYRRLRTEWFGLSAGVYGNGGDAR